MCHRLSVNQFYKHFLRFVDDDPLDVSALIDVAKPLKRVLGHIKAVPRLSCFIAVTFILTHQDSPTNRNGNNENKITKYVYVLFSTSSTLVRT